MCVFFAVKKLESYTSCVKCNAKVASIDEDSIGECFKCGTMQSTEECKQTVVVQLSIKAENGNKFSLSSAPDNVRTSDNFWVKINMSG